MILNKTNEHETCEIPKTAKRKSIKLKFFVWITIGIFLLSSVIIYSIHLKNRSIKKQTFQVMEEYLNNCECFFSCCNAEELYIKLSDAFELNHEEENFGYWIRILDDDYLFKRKTDMWKDFQKNTHQRETYYSKIQNIPDIISNDADIKKLHTLVNDCHDVCSDLYILVTEPDLETTRTEFYNDYYDKIRKNNKNIKQAFNIIRRLEDRINSK